MCKDNKKCKACALASIGKTMAKSRKSSKGATQNALLLGAGGVLGAVLVPKAQDALDPEGKLSNTYVNLITAGVGIFGAPLVKKFLGKNFGEEASKLVMGMGIGGVIAAGTSFAKEQGWIGYVINPNTDLERIVGYGPGQFQDSRYNAGEL